MNRNRAATRARKLLALAAGGVMAFSALLIVPETGAARSGRGSVKHSSRGRGGASAGRTPGRGGPDRCFDGFRRRLCLRADRNRQHADNGEYDVLH